jgi:predicted dehydrogenase
VHVPALRAVGIDVVALVGRDAARTQRRAARLGVAHACTSLDEALTLVHTDIVTIATPPHTHAEVAIAAARAGRHVLCEKPFALDTRDAMAMLDAVRAAGVVHAVGHEFRFAPARAAIGRAISSGDIGEPRLVSLVQLVPLLADPAARMPEWWFDPARGGGWLGASGSHVVDQVRAWLGEFASVSASLPTVAHRDAGAAEDSFVVRFGLRSGADGVLVQSAAAWADAGGMTVVAGTRATVGIDAGDAWIADGNGRRSLPIAPDLAVGPAPSAAEAGTSDRFTHLELGPYTRLCGCLRAAVTGDEPPSPVTMPTFADGVACMQVIDAIRTSAASGGSLVPIA